MFANSKINKLYQQNFIAFQAEMQELQEKSHNNHQKIFRKSQKQIYTRWLDYGVDHSYLPIYALYGCCTSIEDLETVKQELIKIISENERQKEICKEKGINLVYFSKCKQSKSNFRKKKQRNIEFSTFKEQIIKKMRPKYLKMINHIHVCHQSKPFTFFSFQRSSLLNQAIDFMVVYHDSLVSLVSHLGPLFDCQLIGEQVQDYQNNGRWLEIFSEDQKKESRKNFQKKRQNTKRIIHNNFSPNLETYKIGFKTGIPMLLEQILEQIHQKHSRQQGIFRKSPSDDQLGKLQQELSILEQQINGGKIIQNPQEYQNIIKKYDAHTLASCVKLFLKRLNPPIVDYSIYEELKIIIEKLHKQANNSSNKDRMTKSYTNQCDQCLNEQQITKICNIFAQKMEQKQKKLLLQLILFLNISIIKNEQSNKMSSYNLSIVLTPCIFRPKQYSIQDMLCTTKMINFLHYLIDHPENLL